MTVLVILVLVLHFSTILQPAQPVFDEQYYVPAARMILEGEGTDRIEHPPLGQLIIVSGIRIFSDNPFGWRVLPVLFGAGGIVFFYLICRRLNICSEYSFLAAFLLAFENLSFIQSSVAMLDVFCLTFMLASFWLHLKGRYIGTGLMIGLAMLCKLTGVLALPVILIYWLLTDRKNFKHGFYPLTIAPATFLGLMPLLDNIIWHKWLNPLDQVSFMLKANTLATFAGSPSEMLSRPWDWILKPEILTYWIDPHYVAMISPTLWVLIIPAFGFSVYQACKGSKAARFAAIWFTGLCLIWMPISLITDRISYIYYIYPALGAICIELALLAESLGGTDKKAGFNNRLKKLISAAVPFFILLHLGAFVILSPILYWWKLPLSAAAYLIARYYLSGRRFFRETDVNSKVIAGE